MKVEQKKVDIGGLSEEAQRRRQALINEVTARYMKAKDSGPKKLPDGALDSIILQAKNDLNIHEFDVPKASIRGRIHRKSPAVMTLKDKSPYDIIDAPLVSTINNWLGQGISVTRAQGLEFANTLLKGKKAATDKDGNPIILDAKWWRNCEYIYLSWFQLPPALHAALRRLTNSPWAIFFQSLSATRAS